MLYQVSPLIQVQLKVTGYQIYFDPKIEIIHQCMEKVLKAIVRVSRNLPRIEKHLLPGCQSTTVKTRWFVTFDFM